MLIVGISGKKRSGKDEAADQIILALQAGFKTAFADALKREVADACCVSVETIEENKAVFRPVLQWWGSNFRRDFQGQTTYWIDQVVFKLATSDAHLAVISDVRFKNEFNFVKDRHGIMLRIESNRCNMDDQHPSETELDDATFDYVLRNDGTLEEFRKAVGVIATKVIAQRL